MLPSDAKISLRALARMLVAGDAVNTVNPVGLVGGELVRASLLSRSIPLSSAVASVGLAAMTQFVAQVCFILSGLPAVLLLVANRELRSGMVALAGALLLAVGLVLFLAWSRSGLVWIKERLDRIRWFRARWASLPERWKALGMESLRALRSRPADFVSSVGASFLGWQTGVIETFVILRLLNQRVGWRQALAIEVLAVAIEGALFFVPAKMGTQEGGKVLIFLAMGLDPARGFALGFIRRLRELTWAAAGLLILGSSRRRTRS